MSTVRLFGPNYSTFVRSARMTLEEKGVAYEIEEFDFMKGMPPAHLSRHPFGKVPAFEHDGTVIYETAAIERYIDEAFEGPSLQPADPLGRARMTQIIALLDSYAYPAMISQIAVPRIVMPMMGAEADEAKIEAGKPRAHTSLLELERFIGDREFLVGDSLSLADLHALPVITYFKLTPEGGAMLEDTPGVRRWYASMSERPAASSFCPEALR